MLCARPNSSPSPKLIVASPAAYVADRDRAASGAATARQLARALLAAAQAAETATAAGALAEAALFIGEAAKRLSLAERDLSGLMAAVAFTPDAESAA